MPTVAQILNSRPDDDTAPLRAMLATVTIPPATGTTSLSVLLHPGDVPARVTVPTDLPELWAGDLVLVLITGPITVVLARIIQGVNL